MALLSNENTADMHMAYGEATGNTRGVARLYYERFSNRYFPGHRMFPNLYCWLREHGSFNEKMRGFDRPGELSDVLT